MRKNLLIVSAITFLGCNVGSVANAKVPGEHEEDASVNSRLAVDILIKESLPTTELSVPAPAEVMELEKTSIKKDKTSDIKGQIIRATIDQAARMEETRPEIAIVDGAGAAEYSFEKCNRPVEPGLAEATPKQTKSGRNIPSSNPLKRQIRRASVNQYNKHVSLANAYMQCMAGQAQRDIDSYNARVSAALKVEQDSVMAELARMEESLND